MSFSLNEIHEIDENDQWIFVETPILSAIRNNQLDLVKQLCEQGADIYLFQPLKLACQLKFQSIIDYLLTKMIVKPSKILSKKENPSCNLSLWYDKEASQWLDALPIGNGSLGGMLFGGYPREIIQLNSDTVWSGCPHDYSHANAFQYLNPIRQLINENQWIDAQQMLREHFFGVPTDQSHYQTVGNLYFDYFLHDERVQSIDNYQRQLNLQESIVKTSYSLNNRINCQSMCFASFPDQSIVYRMKSTQNINTLISFSSPQNIEISSDFEKRLLIVDGVAGSHEQMKGTIRFCLLVHIETDGQLIDFNDRFLILNSNEILLRIVISTNYVNYLNLTGDQRQLSIDKINKCLSFDFDELFSRHLLDYQQLFNRVQLNLGESSSMNLPTNRRIELFSSDPDSDPQLLTLYFQFGRYLLISSSREGSQTSTLQGIWNDSMSPAWGSKYTININIEMNYWIASVTNLIECYQPLFHLIEDIYQTGQRTAQIHYGTKRSGSWVCHHNTDIWRGTAPVDDPIYGAWPMGGIWLLKSIYDHFQFTNDQQNLLRYYEIIRNAGQFVIENLVEYSGYLMTNPSMSPEVPHHVQLNAVVCQGPTLDILLIKDLFHFLIQSSILFHIDEQFRQELEQCLQRLPPLQIGHEGQLQEWFHDWDRFADQQNRHMSHLYCIYPGYSKEIEDNEQYKQAVIRSLTLRGIYIESPGWSLAWKACIWSRLYQGQRSFELLKMLLTPRHTSTNLFDLIDGPPFQIDANFGGTAAIAEMLLQSHRNQIELLPALPQQHWINGFVRGLRARGNYLVNIYWTNSLLDHAQIIPLQNCNNHLKIVYQNKQIVIEHLSKDLIYNLNSNFDVTTIDKSKCYDHFQ